MISERDLIDILMSYEREINNVSFFVGRNIPEKKEINAVEAYGDRRIGRVYALYDGTIFGSAKEGFFLTDRGIYYHYLFDSWAVDYDDIENIEIGRGNSDRPDPKSDILYIQTRRGEYKLEISTLDKIVLCNLIEDICGCTSSGRRPLFGRRGNHFTDRYDRHQDAHFDPRPDTHFDRRPDHHYDSHHDAHFDGRPDHHFDSHHDAHFDRRPDGHFDSHRDSHSRPGDPHRPGSGNRFR